MIRESRKFVTTAGISGFAAGLALLTCVGSAHAELSSPVNPVSQRIMANGCTGVPDSGFGVSFQAACNAHDACYSHSSSTPRASCDARLRSDMKQACAASSTVTLCRAQADVYYLGVRRLGRSYYKGTGDPS